MVLETEPQHAENTHFPPKIKIQESMQRFQDKQKMVQFFKFISYDILTSAELKFRFVPQQRKIELPGLWYAEGKTATRRSYISMIQTTIPQHLNCWSTLDWNDLLQKKENLVRQRWRRHGAYSKEVIPVGERKWNDILACQHFRGHTFEAEASKLVMRLVRRYDQDERETDGAVHWNSMGPNLRKAFEKAGGHKLSDPDWLQKMYKGSNKTRFRYCKNSRDVLVYNRAIQGHTGGNVIAPELMGHVAIPYKMERIPVSSRMLWCHFNLQIRTHRRRTRKWRKTDHLLDTSQPIWGEFRWSQAMTSRSREKYSTTASPLMP